MYLIRCPSIRSRQKNGTYKHSAICEHVLGFYEKVSRGTVTVIQQCPSCKGWYLIKISPETQTLELINKDSLDFTRVMKPETLTYKVV